VLQTDMLHIGRTVPQGPAIELAQHADVRRIHRGLETGATSGETQ